MAIFSSFEMTASSGNYLEAISHAHKFSLVFALTTSNKGSDDLSIGFDRDRNRRRDDLTNNKTVNRKCQLRNLLTVFLDLQNNRKKVLMV